MSLEILTVAGTFILAIISFNVALIALDIVEHVLMLMKKLGRVLLEQFYEFIEFGLTLQQWMLIQKLAGIVVRLQFVECLKITDAGSAMAATSFAFGFLSRSSSSFFILRHVLMRSL